MKHATATLPDGTTKTRRTEHIYTHALVALTPRWDRAANTWGAPVLEVVSFHHSEETARKALGSWNAKAARRGYPASNPVLVPVVMT